MSPAFFKQLLEFRVLFPLELDSEFTQGLINSVRKVSEKVEEVGIERVVFIEEIALTDELNVKCDIIVLSNEPKEQQQEAEQTTHERESIKNLGKRTSDG